MKYKFWFKKILRCCILFVFSTRLSTFFKVFPAIIAIYRGPLVLFPGGFLPNRFFNKMSLNSRMHPRNPYKDKPPDFEALAGKYEEFRSCCKIGTNGKVSFKALYFRF